MYIHIQVCTSMRMSLLCFFYKRLNSNTFQRYYIKDNSDKEMDNSGIYFLVELKNEYIYIGCSKIIEQLHIRYIEF